MIEFTGHIQVTLIHETANVVSGAGVHDFMADPFDFQPVASDESGGLSYNCDKTFVIDLPDAETLRKFSIPRSCIVSCEHTCTLPDHPSSEPRPAPDSLQNAP